MAEGDIQNAILEDEAANIATQLKNVETTLTSQNRVIALNSSYSKKMALYTRLILAIIFALAIAILLKILKYKFMIIPNAVLIIVYILLFSACAIYGMFVISDINSREPTDFDKLDLGPPVAVNKQINRGINSGRDVGEFDFLPGYCMGSSCCTEGSTAWDDTNSKCIAGCGVGSVYDTTTKKCTKCAAGESSTGELTGKCTACAAGSYTTDGTACKLCAANTYSAAGASVCTNCEDGKTSFAGSASCVDVLAQ